MVDDMWQRVGLVAAAGIIWLLFFGFLAEHTEDSIAHAVTSSFQAWFTSMEEAPSPSAPPEPSPPLRYSSLGELPTDAFNLEELEGAPYYGQFRDLLDRFVVRQGVDDNFTIRVYDDRTNEVLEVFELDSTRALYNQVDSTNWTAVDRERRRITRVLLDKYEAAGIPREELSVRWGRANQVREAFERNQPYLQYEVRLAKWLDLSLLSTQIGMVETFNQPELTSPAGARGQYQMMPYMLRKFGIQQYTLPTAAGTEIQVREEHHPLLTMEPALYLIRAYSNAVGHEIPGISAYHTGPGNIFNLFRHFLVENDPSTFSGAQTVVDAYLWGLTDGFSIVNDRTSFGYYSRGYVTSALGALRAVEDFVVDTTQTLAAEQVQLQAGSQIILRDLLQKLPADSAASPGVRYQEFRRLNPHFDLPPPADSGDLPDTGNIQLTRRAGGHTVRFFLPRGSVDSLESAGVDVLDRDEIRRFDHQTYRSGNFAPEMTEWDRAYRELVNRVQQFGFTDAHRQQLDTIVVHLEHLADLRPTPYRKAQARIAQIHQQMWNSRPWERLADVVAARKGSYLIPPRPLDLPERDLPTSLDRTE